MQENKIVAFIFVHSVHCVSILAG